MAPRILADLERDFLLCIIDALETAVESHLWIDEDYGEEGENHYNQQRDLTRGVINFETTGNRYQASALLPCD